MPTGNSPITADPKQRRHAKLEFGTVPGLMSVELSHGSEIEIVNISREGMILETDTCLRPDFKVVLKAVTSKGPMRIEGVVRRSAICSLEGRPKYRSTVEFKQPLELSGETVLPAPEIPPVDDAPAPSSEEVEGTEAPAILTVLQAATMTTA